MRMRLARLAFVVPAALLAMAADCDFGPRGTYTQPPCTVSDDAGVALDFEDNQAEQALVYIPDTLVLLVPTPEGTRLCRPGLEDHCDALIEEECVVDLGTAPIGGERVVEVFTSDGPIGRARIDAVRVEGCPEVSASIEPDSAGYPLVRLVYAPTERGACRGDLVIDSWNAGNLVQDEVTLPLRGDAFQRLGPR